MLLLLKKLLLLIALFSVLFVTLAFNPGPVHGAGSNTEYSIHVSSFKSEKNAAEAQASFIAAGLPSFSQYENVQGKGMWYRVYVGHFEDKTEARALALSLKARGVISYFQVITVSKPQPPAPVRNKMPAHVDVTHLTPQSNIFPMENEVSQMIGQPKTN